MMITTQENPRSNSTLSLLLDGAERSIFLHGYKGASIRRITQEAGTNIASINYHFGSKKELFAALIQRRLDAVIQQRTESLQSMKGGTECSIDDVIRAYFGALFQIRQSVGQDVVVVIWALLIGDPDVSRLSDRPVDDSYIKVRRRYAQALAAVTSGIPVEEFEWRLEILERFALSVMVVPNACRTFGSTGSNDAAAMQPRESLNENLMSMIRASIQAPLAIQIDHRKSSGQGG